MNDIVISNTNRPNFFHFIEVRPIVPEEKDAWNELMAEHHYLGFSFYQSNINQLVVITLTDP